MFLADCPARTTLSVIGDSWSVVVVAALSERHMRYSELHQRIGGISKKMLTQTLRRLVRMGIVDRRPDSPRHYRLTALGESLREPVAALVRWAEDHTDELLAVADVDPDDGGPATNRPGLVDA